MKQSADQRFPGLSFAGVLAAGLLAGCKGSSGVPSDGLPPVLVSASFGGAGATPVDGDLLLLFFSEDVRDATGTAIDDADLALSGGATLGAGAMVTAQPTARSLRITLGSGVAFTPGTTTVGFAAANNVIADLAGNLGAPGTVVVIDTSDGANPTVDALTLSAIHPELNGTGPAGGTLQVPVNGWSVDAAWSDTGLGVDPARAQVTANVTVATASGPQPAGTNLVPFLTAVTVNGAVGSWRVPAATSFPAGAVTLSVVAVDAGGLASLPRTFPFTVRPFSAALQPFETNVNPQQVWFVDTGRDIEAFTTMAIAGGARIDVVQTANGRSDMLDILFVLGMQSTAPLPNVIGGDDSNTVVLDRFLATILAELAALFPGVNTSFTLTDPGGSFGGSTSVPYANLGYSQICLAGSAETPGVLGVAQFDPNNTRQNDDCLLEGQNGSLNRLGVFLHTVADSGLGPPSTSTFRLVFNAFAPAIGGTPIGDAAGDDMRLTGALNDTRTVRIDAAIADLGRFAAVVLAHEMGHSVGLVQNGPMPLGLYGNDPTNFPGSANGHIRTQSHFPAGSTNVMSPQLSYPTAIDGNTGFNSLNLAYLREQAFYGN